MEAAIPVPHVHSRFFPLVSVPFSEASIGPTKSLGRAVLIPSFIARLRRIGVRNLQTGNEEQLEKTGTTPGPTCLLKQKQRDKSTTTIAIKKRTAAIDSGRRIDPGASVPVPARPQEEGALKEYKKLSGFTRSLGREHDRPDASTNERATMRTTLDEVCDSQK